MKSKVLIAAALAFSCLLTACSSEHKVAIVAHRGYWESEAAGKAHNSIAALAEAQRIGVWGSEFDVNMTNDGVLLVFHDGEVNGKAFIEHDAADFADVTLPNGENIPTLDEYLDQFEKGRDCRLVFELKTHPSEFTEIAVDKSIAALKEHGLFDPKQVIFISFSIEQCELFAKKCPGFTVQFLNDTYSIEQLCEKGINGIDSHYNVFYRDSTWYSAAREHSMSINAWTVNEEHDIHKMIELGVDYITTNKPEKVRAILKDMGVKELKAGENFKSHKR